MICSSAEQFRNDCLQEKLNEKFPQYNVIVMYMPTGKTAAKILTEGKNTEVDMLVGVETGYLRKIQDSLADISGRSNIQYIDGLEPVGNVGTFCWRYHCEHRSLGKTWSGGS